MKANIKKYLMCIKTIKQSDGCKGSLPPVKKIYIHTFFYRFLSHLQNEIDNRII